MAGQRLDIDKVVLIGRTYEEYEKMFRLRDFEGGAEKILDAGSGVSGFRAGAARRGFDATACDRIYALTPGELEHAALCDLARVMEKMQAVTDQYNWAQFEDIPALERGRRSAVRAFAQDYRLNPSRYVCGSFPATGFDDEAFTVTLSSHFLFMYDDILDYDFHRETLLEMLRITSKEVRIFPLVNLKGERSPFVRRLLYEALNRGCGVSIDRVDYEFVKNGNQMLRIQK